MSSMSNKQIPEGWAGVRGTVYDQRIQRTQTLLLTWQCGFRKIIWYCYASISAPTRQGWPPHFFEIQVGHKEENFYERAEIFCYSNNPQGILKY